MKQIYQLVLIIVFNSSLSFLQAQTVHPHCVDGKIWMKLKDNVPWSLPQLNLQLDAAPSSYPIPLSMLKQFQSREVIKPFPLMDSPELQRTYQINFESVYEVDAFIDALKKLDFIEYAERVPLNRTCVTPNDPNYSSDQWHLPVIKADSAWNYTTGSSSVVVAIVDNGVQTNHIDLAANMWVNAGEIPGNGKDDDGNGYKDDINGFDVSDSDGNPNPPNASFTHGTHVAGCAGEVSNNNIGGASVGYNIRLMAVKATSDGAGNPSIIEDGYAGVQYAAASGADVINMSWGSYSYSATAQNIINAAYNKGIVLVAAAGNDSTTNPTYPAAYNNVIAIASAKKKDEKAKTSNYGSYIDVVSPGAVIYSTVPFDQFAILSGTSMASPVAAGLCGLILSANPSLTPAQVENCLKTSADPMPNEPLYASGNLGSGRINALKAVQCAMGITEIAEQNNQAEKITSYVNHQTGQLVVHSEEGLTGTLFLVNQLGQVLHGEKLALVSGNAYRLNVEALSPGIYYLIIEGKTNYQAKVLKQ